MKKFMSWRGAIRNTTGIVEIVRADDIQTVFIPAKDPKERPFFGIFVDWEDGVYQLNVRFEIVKIKDGVMQGFPEPIAPAKPTLATAESQPAALRMPRPSATARRCRLHWNSPFTLPTAR
jgi:hypothetical protein